MEIFFRRKKILPGLDRREVMESTIGKGVVLDAHVGNNPLSALRWYQNAAVTL